jgi:hypothetical protein
MKKSRPTLMEAPSPETHKKLKDRMGEVVFQHVGRGRVRAILPEWADVYWEVSLAHHENGFWKIGRIRCSSGPRDFESFVASEQEAETEVVKLILEREMIPAAARWAAINQEEIFTGRPVGEENNPEAWDFEAEDRVSHLIDWAEDYVTLADEYIKGAPGTSAAIKKCHLVARELRKTARAIWDLRAELRKLALSSAPVSPEPLKRKAA